MLGDQGDPVISEIFDRNRIYDDENGEDGDDMSETSFQTGDGTSSDTTGNNNDMDALNSQQKIANLSKELQDLKNRLKRRNEVMEALRRSYLKDIVIVKYWVKEVLKDDERIAVINQVEANIPSLDLTKPLLLHAPKDSEFRLKPCDNCGGRIDIVLNDSLQVVKLKQKMEAMKEMENSLRLHAATVDAKMEKLSVQCEAQEKSHQEEVLVFILFHCNVFCFIDRLFYYFGNNRNALCIQKCAKSKMPWKQHKTLLTL